MKLVILDRDGVINQDSLYYVKSPDEYVLLPGSAQAIARLTTAGYRVAVATNQSGVARGYYDEKKLAAIHDKMHTAVFAAGGRIDHVVYCPHHPEALCTCRKPAPGMLFAIAAHFGCSLKNTPFVGDRLSDIQAAEAAGATPMLILSTMTERRLLSSHPHVPVFRSLAECVDELLALSCVV